MRMPLTPGDSVVGMWVLVGVLGAPLYLTSTCLLGPGWGWSAATAVWIVATLFVGLVGWFLRPSDVRLDADGLEVIGGHHGGLQIALEATEALSLRVEADDEHVLTFHEDDLARSAHPEEAASLRALVATVRAAATARVPGPDPGPQVGRCAMCAAPLIPADSTTVRCSHCGHENPLSDEVRAVAGAQQVAPVVAEVLGRLEHWPTAARINALIGGAWVVLAVGWPLVAGIALWAPSLDGLDRVVLGAVGTNLAITLPLRVLATTADRRAFAWVGVRFASPPPLLGEPHACRSCAGPLPEPYGRSQTPAVARCGWCGTDSVVGLGLVTEAIAIRDGADDLVQAAVAQEASRTARRRGASVSLVALVMSPLALASVLWG